MTAAEPGAVDRLLDELFDELAGSGAAVRRALTEAEDHLAAAVADAMARGLTRAEAEAEAVSRFGAARPFATRLRTVYQGPAATLRQTIAGAGLVVAVGLLAVGLSGLVAEALGRAFGPAFVAGDAADVTYTAQRCTDFFEYFPDAGTCAQAAALHHWGEVVEYRVAAGVLGLLALLGWWSARRTLWRGPAWRPSAPVVGIVLVALFGVSGLGLIGLSSLQIVFGQTAGTGADLSAGVVAMGLALVVGVRLMPRTAPRMHHPGS